MKFTCAYCGLEYEDDSGRPGVKICRPSGFIIAYFTFCNEEHQEEFMRKLYRIREGVK